MKGKKGSKHLAKRKVPMRRHARSSGKEDRRTAALELEGFHRAASPRRRPIFRPRNFAAASSSDAYPKTELGGRVVASSQAGKARRRITAHSRYAPGELPTDEFLRRCPTVVQHLTA